MPTTRARLTPVRLFQEDRGSGRSRRHVLAIYDNGQLRVLIDRGERMATRLLAILNDGKEHKCVDGPPQIKALCDEYVRQYLLVGGPLACRLTREHLGSARFKRGAPLAAGMRMGGQRLSAAALSFSRPAAACPSPRARTPTKPAAARRHDAGT